MKERHIAKIDRFINGFRERKINTDKKRDRERRIQFESHETGTTPSFLLRREMESRFLSDPRSGLLSPSGRAVNTGIPSPGG